MFESIRTSYVSGVAVVKCLYRVHDHNGVLSHYVASLEMQLLGKVRTILANFYPEEAEKLWETIGIASDNNRMPQASRDTVLTVHVQLLNLSKAFFSKYCTALLINAEFTSLSKEILIKTRNLADLG
jgi:hypothetical protein